MVGGDCVGMVNACLVGGSVEVTKRGAFGFTASCVLVFKSTQEISRLVQRIAGMIVFGM